MPLRGLGYETRHLRDIGRSDRSRLALRGPPPVGGARSRARNCVGFPPSGCTPQAPGTERRVCRSASTPLAYEVGWRLVVTPPPFRGGGGPYILPPPAYGVEWGLVANPPFQGGDMSYVVVMSYSLSRPEAVSFTPRGGNAIINHKHGRNH